LTKGLCGCHAVFFVSPLAGSGIHLTGTANQQPPANIQTIQQFKDWVSGVLKQETTRCFEAFQAIHAQARTHWYNQWAAGPQASEASPAGDQYRTAWTNSMNYIDSQLKAFVLVATPPANTRPDVMETARNQIAGHISTLNQGIRVRVYPYDDQAIANTQGNYDTYVQSTWGTLPAGVVFSGQCRPFS